MPAYGYEFYLLVVNSISHSFAALTREISSWPLEDKIHIHARACNILYLSVIYVLPYFVSRSPFFRSQLPRAWNRLENTPVWPSWNRDYAIAGKCTH